VLNQVKYDDWWTEAGKVSKMLGVAVWSVQRRSRIVDQFVNMAYEGFLGVERRGEEVKQ